MTITSKMLSNPIYTHALVYIGAPYSDNEGGHVVSLHKSKDNAVWARRRLGELRGRAHTIVTLDSTAKHPRWVFGDVETPRQYFLETTMTIG